MAQGVLSGTCLLQEYCLRFVVKDSNYSQIVMSREFETLEQPLMVEIIRRKQMPQQRLVDPQGDNMRGESVWCRWSFCCFFCMCVCVFVVCVCAVSYTHLTLPTTRSV